MRAARLSVFWVVAAMALSGCPGPGGGTCEAVAMQPASDAGVTALIITNAALKPSFERYATLHSVTGVRTAVKTVEDLCAAGTCVDSDSTRDTVKAIKDALKAQPGLQYVLLGGGIDVVPARQVHDEYANPLATSYSFTADFVTDYYYSDFSEWDTNHDGVYAQKGVDTPGYLPAVPVSRVPVHTAAEAAAYFDKVVHHLTSYDAAAVQKALVMSNVAANYQGMNIDAAIYLEADGRTNSLLPPSFTLEKLYATTNVDPSAASYSSAHEVAALQAGQNLVVHSGHAGPGEVTVEIDGSEAFTGGQASQLTNSTLPIFLSCGCEAGDYSVSYRAGEKLMLAPSGGAIAYLGNAPIGLGLAGGMQMIDELLRNVQAHDPVLLADAYLAAHQNLPTTDTFHVTVLVPLNIPVMDSSSYAWTQKSVVLFGDTLIPVWKAPRPKGPTITASKMAICGGSALTFAFDVSSKGTFRVQAGGALYEVPVNGTSVTWNVPGNPSAVTAGFASDSTQYGFAELAL